MSNQVCTCKVYADTVPIGACELEYDPGMGIWTGSFAPSEACLPYSALFKKWADALDRKAGDAILNPLRQEMKKLNLRVEDEKGKTISRVVFIADFRPHAAACQIEAYAKSHG